MEGADDVARTGAPSPPNFLTRRVLVCSVRQEANMRFKASIQNVHTFTSKRVCSIALMIVTNLL
jgi:hypothetical protein